jgi:hypothetical protein
MRTSLDQDIDEIRRSYGSSETELTAAPARRALPDIIPESASGEIPSTDEEGEDPPETETRTEVDTTSRVNTEKI